MRMFWMSYLGLFRLSVQEEEIQVSSFLSQMIPQVPASSVWYEINDVHFKAGRLVFERTSQGSQAGHIRRPQYILIDVKYLLTTKPTIWTDELKKGYLHGLYLLLELLSWMEASH